jgi:hypothetical protein
MSLGELWMCVFPGRMILGTFGQTDSSGNSDCAGLFGLESPGTFSFDNQHYYYVGFKRREKNNLNEQVWNKKQIR